MTENKWYQSNLGFGLGILLAGLGIGSCSYLDQKGTSLSLRESPSITIYPTQERDINGNETPEKIFYVDGVPAVSEVDGEPILEFLKKNK